MGLAGSTGAEDDDPRSDINDFDNTNYDQLLQTVTSNIITTICVTFPEGELIFVFETNFFLSFSHLLLAWSQLSDVNKKVLTGEIYSQVSVLVKDTRQEQAFSRYFVRTFFFLDFFFFHSTSLFFGLILETLIFF